MLWWLLLATISIYISYQDITKRTIPNKSCFLVTILSIFISLEIQNCFNIGYVLGIFLIGFVLFSLKIIAAGDIKLLASFFIAIKPEYSPMTLFIISLLGGFLGISYYLKLKLFGRNCLINHGVPYGIPICIGCLFGIAASI